MKMRQTADIDPRIKTELVTAGGLEFEVDMCGDGDRLAICLHGFPEHSVSWRHQLPMLADLGYTAWAPNMRGYGNSPLLPDMEDYQLEILMNDVANLMDAAGKEDITLIAHDWGGVIAWYFAIREIRPLANLIVCNLPHPAAMQRAFNLKQLMKSWYAFFFQIPGLPEAVMKPRQGRGFGQMIKDSACNPELFSDDVVALYNENGASDRRRTAMVNYYRALIRGGGSKRQQALGFPRVKTRTLMVWGEDDMALRKELTYGTEDYVEDLTIRYLPRISHWVQQDAPDVVNAMMAAFLKGQSVPGMHWEMVLDAADEGDQEA